MKRLQLVWTVHNLFLIFYIFEKKVSRIVKSSGTISCSFSFDQSNFIFRISNTLYNIQNILENF